MANELDVLGELVMKHLRDEGFDFFDRLEKGEWKSPGLLALQRELGELDAAGRQVARRAARAAMDHAVHEFLFSLHEACEAGNVEVRINGREVTDLSDGLHGELFTDDGWQSRLSAYGESDDEA